RSLNGGRWSVPPSRRFVASNDPLPKMTTAGQQVDHPRPRFESCRALGPVHTTSQAGQTRRCIARRNRVAAIARMPRLQGANGCRFHSRFHLWNSCQRTVVMGQWNRRAELVDGLDCAEVRRQATATDCDLSLPDVRSAEIIRAGDLTRVAAVERAVLW